MEMGFNWRGDEMSGSRSAHWQMGLVGTVSAWCPFGLHNKLYMCDVDNWLSWWLSHCGMRIRFFLLMRVCMCFFYVYSKETVFSVIHFGLLPVFNHLPSCRPCLLSHGHRPWLRASGVLWLSINSGVRSISLQLLQKNRAQRAMFKTWLRLALRQRCFCFCSCFTAGTTYHVHCWTDQTVHSQTKSLLHHFIL